MSKWQKRLKHKDELEKAAKADHIIYSGSTDDPYLKEILSAQNPTIIVIPCDINVRSDTPVPCRRDDVYDVFNDIGNRKRVPITITESQIYRCRLVKDVYEILTITWGDWGKMEFYFEFTQPPPFLTPIAIMQLKLRGILHVHNIDDPVCFSQIGLLYPSLIRKDKWVIRNPDYLNNDSNRYDMLLSKYERLIKKEDIKCL